MKPVQNYSQEAVERLKQWIAEMNANSDPKYYEIFVDGMRIVSKTNDVEEFDRYLVWVGEDTQQVKVLVYNTIGSHRSKVFEFRTFKYPNDVNYKEIISGLQNKNDELTKRLANAEEHILSLEGQGNSINKGGFDIEKIARVIGQLAKQFPGLAGNLNGFGHIFKSETETGTKEQEDFEVSFNRKESHGACPTDNATDKREDHINFTSKVKLDVKQRAGILELIEFFCVNTEYIETVLNLVNQEKVSTST